jgi:hypothetical protein
MKKNIMNNDDIAHKLVANYLKIYLIKKNDHLSRKEYRKVRKNIEVSRFLGLLPKSHSGLVL